MEGHRRLLRSQRQRSLLTELTLALDSRGTLEVFRPGVDFFGQTFRLTVTRQVHFSRQHDQSTDILLSLNGLPVATAELKNAFTGQTLRNAIQQYRDRDHREPLLAFKKRASSNSAGRTILLVSARQPAG